MQSQVSVSEGDAGIMRSTGALGHTQASFAMTARSSYLLNKCAIWLNKTDEEGNGRRANPRIIADDGRGGGRLR